MNPPKPLSTTPPLNGSFPLDVSGKCAKIVQEYVQCLKSEKNCDGLAKKYLSCRMEVGLMQEENVDELFENS